MSPCGSHSLCRRPGTDPETNANLCSLSLSNQPTTFTEFFFLFFPRPTYIGKAAVTSSFWGHYTYSCLASLLSELRPWTRQHHQACFHKKSKRKSERLLPRWPWHKRKLMQFQNDNIQAASKKVNLNAEKLISKAGPLQRGLWVALFGRYLKLKCRELPNSGNSSWSLHN